MDVLFLAEVTDGELALDATAKAVSAASELGDVTALCCGGSAAAAGAAVRIVVHRHPKLHDGPRAPTQGHLFGYIYSYT